MIGNRTIILLAGFALLVAGQACLKHDPLNQPFKGYEPVQFDDGLVISDPASEQVDGDALRDIYLDMHDEDLYWQFRSMLVFRNGKLVSESYMKDDADISRRHLIWSCTKQFMGVLVGLAQEEGLINDINDPLSDYLSEAASYPDKDGISIRNLLMMQSGIDYSNDGVEGQTDKILRQLPDNITEFVMARPVYKQPGTDFHYNDGDPQLLSAMIQQLAGKPTDEWADDVLFSKIGFENYNWVRYRDGVILGGFGIETTPREMAKLALCVADSGFYNGQQVIPKDWLEEMLSEQIVIDDDYSFGYFWWIDRNREISFMAGHGGQYAYIIPRKDLVVIMTAIPNTQGDHQINFADATPLIDRIISICQ